VSRGRVERGHIQEKSSGKKGNVKRCHQKWRGQNQKSPVNKGVREAEGAGTGKKKTLPLKHLRPELHNRRKDGDRKGEDNNSFFRKKG